MLRHYRLNDALCSIWRGLQWEKRVIFFFLSRRCVGFPAAEHLRKSGFDVANVAAVAAFRQTRSFLCNFHLLPSLFLFLRFLHLHKHWTVFFCSNNAIAKRVLIVLPLKEFFASVGSPKKNYFSGYYFFFFYCCSLLAKHAGAALGCLLLWVFSVSCTQLVNGLLLFLFLFFLLWFRRGVKSLRYRRVAPRPDLHLFFFFTLFLFLSFLFLVLSKTFLFSFSFLIAGVSPPLPPFFTRW